MIDRIVSCKMKLYNTDFLIKRAFKKTFNLVVIPFHGFQNTSDPLSLHPWCITSSAA